MKSHSLSCTSVVMALALGVAPHHAAAAAEPSKATTTTPDLGQQRDVLLKEHEAWQQAQDHWQRDLQDRKSERDDRRQAVDPDAHVREMQKAAEKVIDRALTKGIPAAFQGKDEKAFEEGKKMQKDLDKELTEAYAAVDSFDALQRGDKKLSALNRDIARLQKDIAIANQSLAENEQQLAKNTQAMKTAFNSWTGKVLGRLAQAQVARDERKQQEAVHTSQSGASRPGQSQAAANGRSAPGNASRSGEAHEGHSSGRVDRPEPHHAEPKDHPEPHHAEPKEHHEPHHAEPKGHEPSLRLR